MRSYPEQVIIPRSATKLHVIIAHRWRLTTIVRKVIKSSGLLMAARATAVLDLAEGEKVPAHVIGKVPIIRPPCPYHAAPDGGPHIPCDAEPDIDARLLEGLRRRGPRHLPIGFCFEAAGRSPCSGFSVASVAPSAGRGKSAIRLLSGVS